MSKQNQEDAAILTRGGLKLAELLQLTQKANGRYDTSWGDKTPMGLFLTVQRFIDGEKPAKHYTPVDTRPMIP